MEKAANSAFPSWDLMIKDTNVIGKIKKSLLHNYQ